MIGLKLRSFSMFCGFVVVAAAVVSAITPPASASIIQYGTPSGATSDQHPVSATATFTMATDSVTVVLSNLTVDPRAMGQNISGISFTLDAQPLSASLFDSFADLRSVLSDGTYVDGLSSVATGWELASSGMQIDLTVLDTPQAPQHTILGLPDPVSGIYDYANASIAKTKGPHNPFIYHTATFVLSAPGVTEDTIVDDVVFSFNSSPGYVVLGELQVGIPEPATLSLLALGGMAMLRRRK